MYEKPRLRRRWWAIYTGVGLVLGVLLEIGAANMPFWFYQPPWLDILVVVFAFGMAPSTLELLLRKRSLFAVVLVGSVLAFLVEGLSALLPGFGWTFVAGFPLAIQGPFWRTVALGIGGGLFILVDHAITYGLYILVERPNRDLEEYERYRKLPVAEIPDPFDRIEQELREDSDRWAECEAIVQELNPEGKRMILSIDGGGSKGYMTLHCLAKLELLTGRRCSDLFDFFAGTSTGSLIAAGLAREMSAHKLLLLYRSKIPEVFNDRAPLFGAFAHLLRPHDPEKLGLKKLIDKLYLLPRNGLRFMHRHDRLWDLVRQVLTDESSRQLILMKDIEKTLLITIKDVKRSQTLFAVNKGPGLIAYGDLPLAYAVMGSSVAPIFLQPLLTWIDGGVGTYTNPCYRASFVASRLITGQTNYGRLGDPGIDEGIFDPSYEADNVIHFSFGTGVSRNTKEEEEAKSTAAHDWLLYVVGEGQEDGSDDQVRATQEQFARREGLDFRRFQIMLDPEVLKASVEDGGIGLHQYLENYLGYQDPEALDENLARIERIVEKMEMDAHSVEELEIMEVVGQAWANALAKGGDGEGSGFSRPQYPYADPVAETGPFERVYFPPATPPQLLPSYLIPFLPNGLKLYRNKLHKRMTDKLDEQGSLVEKGYITDRMEGIEKELFV